VTLSILSVTRISTASHIEQANLLLTRDPRPLPTMRLNPEVRDIRGFTSADFTLEGYDPHPAIKAAIPE